MSRAAKALREIPFTQIERNFTLRAYAGRPAVGANLRGFYIRVLIGMSWQGTRQTEKFDYFYIDPDGTVSSAPRGYAKDYRPARITGMDDAIRRYAIGSGEVTS